MTYHQAITAARAGKAVKRECWETWLRMRAGRLEFQLEDNVAQELGTRFNATDCDRDANDWEARP